jgi:hypothetical protein
VLARVFAKPSEVTKSAASIWLLQTVRGLEALVDNHRGHANRPQDERMHDLPDPDWYLDHVVLPSGIEQYKVGPVRAWQASWAALALQLRGSVDESPVGAAIELALDQGFVLTRAQTMRCGVTDAELRRLVRSGDWTRCGHGCFATVRAPAEDDEHDAARRRHAVAAAAAALRRRRHTIGGASAVILHGLPVFDIPDRPQLITDVRGNTGPRQAVDVRVARLAPDERDDWYGVPCAALVRAVVDLLRMDPRSGLMAADAALHEGLVRQQELTSGVERAATKPGIRRAREVLELASPLIESPLESVTHLALHDSGFPPPELQRPIQGADGKRYRVDFCWPDLRLILEADGRRKYREDVQWREKAREIALTRVGYRVERVRWVDIVDDWPATRDWLRELIAARADRAARPRTV